MTTKDRDDRYAVVWIGLFLGAIAVLVGLGGPLLRGGSLSPDPIFEIALTGAVIGTSVLISAYLWAAGSRDLGPRSDPRGSR